MGCVFCASGLLGVERNLSRSELLEQVLRSQAMLPPDKRVSHLVIMGMGESLANLDNLISALDWTCSPEGFGLSQRRVTISTVGLPEKMKRLAGLNRSYHLAVSLHAAREEVRNQLVPVNERIGLQAVMEASDLYFQTSGRQVTFEYVLLSGINDGPDDVQALARLLDRRKAHVNLIPYNPVPGLPYQRPSDRSIRDFVSYLRNHGISVTVRQTRGRPIDAACGQLRRRFQAQSPAPAIPAP
jgi:23S rRNA (adenine2503-C2)-methyltransferase